MLLKQFYGIKFPFSEESDRLTFFDLDETKADGMILVCDNDKKRKIAENIIRHTMWNRKSLLIRS